MRRQQNPAPSPSVTVEDDGLSIRGFAMLALSAGSLLVCIAVAVAIWQVSTGIKWALLILATGSSVQMILVGLGIYRRHELAGRAGLIEAQGRADANRVSAQAEMLVARHTHRARGE